MTRCVCEGVGADLPADLGEDFGDRAAIAPAAHAPQAGKATNRRGTAIHEAAHAVFAILADCVIHSATIIPTQCSLGRVRWWQPKLGYGTLEKQILVFIAGPLAESIADQDLDPTSDGVHLVIDDTALKVIERMHKLRPLACCETDLCNALHRLLYRRDHSSAASLRLDYVRAGHTVLQILRNAMVWTAIRNVADALLASLVIDDAAIRDAMPDELHGVPLMVLARGMASPLAPSLSYPTPVYPPIAPA